MKDKKHHQININSTSFQIKHYHDTSLTFQHHQFSQMRTSVIAHNCASSNFEQIHFSATSGNLAARVTLEVSPLIAVWHVDLALQTLAEFVQSQRHHPAPKKPSVRHVCIYIYIYTRMCIYITPLLCPWVHYVAPFFRPPLANKVVSIAKLNRWSWQRNQTTKRRSLKPGP